MGAEVQSSNNIKQELVYSESTTNNMQSAATEEPVFSDWQAALHFLCIIKSSIQWAISFAGGKIYRLPLQNPLSLNHLIPSAVKHSEMGSLQPAELEHMEMNISLLQLQYAPSISDKDTGSALKVSALHVKMMLPRRQSTLLIAFRGHNMTSTDP